MLYRSHRGGLSESMKTVVEVNTIEELKDHISSKIGSKVLDIKIEYYTYDDRIKWETYIVECRVETSPNNWFVSGFINGDLK